jgi:spore coat protein U-like protein
MTRPICTAIVLFLLATGPAWTQSCSFSVTNVNFGNVDTLSGATADTTGTVDISCNGGLLGANFRICLNINAGSGGATSGTRHMLNASNASLDYNFYQDAAHSIPWGSREQPTLGNPMALTLTAPILGTVSTTRTMEARIPSSQQSVSSGFYSATFSGAETSFNWVTYLLFPPDCSSVTQNPVRPTFTVQANVVPNCMVSAQNINFGNHGVLNTAIDATGSLGVTCSPGIGYAVGLNNGLTGGSPISRRMTLGSEAVIYGLFKDAARSQPWGNAGSELVPGSGTGATQNLPVYGRVQSQPTPSPGAYSDTVVVTVTY